jgi:putative tricarboxylic transport membrane protein
MSTWMRRGDFWSGLALAFLGAYIVGQARGWVYMGEDGPGAGFFPMWYGGAMIVLSLLLVAGTVLKAARASAPPGRVQWRDLGRAFACWAAFVACIALMPLVGFVISFALLTWFIVRVMAGERQRIAIGLAIAGSIAFYALFELALDLSLPRGLLF